MDENAIPDALKAIDAVVGTKDAGVEFNVPDVPVSAPVAPLPVQVPKKSTAPAIPFKPISIAPPKPKAPETADISPSAVAEELSGIPTLRTYRQDVAGAVKSQNTSLVRMVIEEQKSRTGREAVEIPSSRKNLPLIAISVLLFLFSIGILYYFFFPKPATPVAPVKTALLVNTDAIKQIPVENTTGQTLLAAVANEAASAPLKLDTTESLVFTKQVPVQTQNGTAMSTVALTSTETLSALNINPPDLILHSLNPDFVLGVYAFNKNQPFIVFSISYYDTARAGLLAWEKSMARDLLPLFGRADLVAPLYSATWADMVIQNNDVRTLRSADGTIALMYMFKGTNAVIITTDEDTLLKISTQFDLMRERKTQ